MGLRILLVSDHYPPFLGGAHRQTQLLGRELAQRGHQVSVVTVWHPGLPVQEQDAGVTVYRLRQLRTCLAWFARDQDQRHQPPFPDPITVWGLRRLVTRLQPDLIHAHGWITFSCTVALLGKDIPLLISARDYGYSCPTRTLLFLDQHPCDGPVLSKCLQCAMDHFGAPKGIVAVASLLGGRSLLLRKIGGIHSVSAFVQAIVQRDLLRDCSFRLEANGGLLLERVISSFLVESENSAPDIEFLSRLPAKPYILFVGGLQRRKGLGTLLAAYERLPAPPPLVLIGYVASDTPEESPTGVTILQNIPHPNVMLAWEHCLFGVMPSVWPDPSPGVVREVMSAGKAVIGTSIGGTTEMIVHGDTGLLVPPNDVDALAKAMQRLIDNAELRERLGQAAREQAKQYTAAANVPRFEQLYQQLLSSSRGRANKHSSSMMVHRQLQYPDQGTHK